MCTENFKMCIRDSLPGDLPGDSVLLSGHMDTVEPSKGKKGIIGEDGVIRSAGKAVLGADDVAGLVEILEGIRSVKEAGVPHRDIEILFTIAEELYIKGSNVFDFSKVRAKEAYVLDISGPVGSAAYKAPSLISYQVVVTEMCIRDRYWGAPHDRAHLSSDPGNKFKAEEQ